ncbi:DNA annealing helicase and endonuclease ZRANB3-like [Amphiura filiformis]|uniref:DNA annealing helicase and endonuclease ZRANB3-like n=1 Tax=Amphiura filiformis TaxID=82378 RepID=UPI003B2267E1
MAAPSVAGDLSFLPKDLRKKLLPFQREGIKFALSRKGRCLIGDEMGLGKTLQAIATAYYYQNEWPLLIVVPTALRYPWIEELEKWLPELQPNDVNLIASGTDIGNIPNCKVSIVGYGLFRNDAKTLMEALTKQKFQVVIVDESHYLKNSKAARTKLVTPIIENAKRAMLLTGTPALGRPSELFTQINSIRPKMMGTWTQFCKRYCDAHWQHYGRTKKSWDTSGASNLEELHRKLKGSIMIRREKKNVLTQLPPKRRQKVPFELAESAEKKEIDQCWLTMRDLWKPPENADNAFNPKFQIQTLAGRMYVLTGKAKIGAVCEYVKILLENQDLKFLVFAHHKEMMTALAQTVMAYQREHKTTMKYIRIDGDVPSMERMHLVRQFQTDEDTRVAILSILAAGTGLTFTAANQVVFAELHWTPGILEQCEDRAHRIGQINSIHVHYLVARGTMDEWIWSALSRKVGVLSSALNGRIQQLKMEEGGEEYADLLKQAAAWLPSNQDDEDDDSFYFTQRQDKTQDIRNFFAPLGSTKGKKRKRTASGKASPKVSKLKGSSVTTPSKSCEPLGLDQSPIIFDSSDDDLPVSEPIQTGVLSTADSEDGNRRSSLEDFVDPSKYHPIRKSVLNDTAEQEKHRVVKSTSNQTVQNRNDVQVLKSTGENDRGAKKPAPSGTDDELPDMVSIIRRRPRKRKSTSLSSDHTTGEATSNDIPPNIPSCSKSHKVRNELSTPSPRRARPELDCVTPTPGTLTRGESSSVDDRSTPGGSKQRDDIQQGQIKWNCSACTFENHGALPFCEICNTPKKTVTTRSRAKTLEHCNPNSITLNSNETESSATTSNLAEKKENVEGIISASQKNTTHAAATSDIIIETTDNSDTITDDTSTHIDDVSTHTDDVTTAASSNDDTCNDNLDIEPVSPMSIGSDSDVIIDSDSPVGSGDLFAESDDKVSSNDGQNQNSVTTNFETPTAADANRTINSPSAKTSSVVAGNQLCSETDVVQLDCIETNNESVGNDTTITTEDESIDHLSSSEQSDIIIKPSTFKIKRKRSRSRSRHSTGPSPDGNKQRKPTSCKSPIAMVTEPSHGNKQSKVAPTESLVTGPSPDGNKQRKPTFCKSPITMVTEPSHSNEQSKVTPTESVVTGLSQGSSTHSKPVPSESQVTQNDSSNSTCQEMSMFSDDIDSFTDSEMVDQLDKFEMGLTPDVTGEPRNAEGECGQSKEIISGDHGISEDDEGGKSEDDTPEPIQVYEAFLFCASKYTDRIYLHDKDQVPLQCFFLALDVQHRDLDSLPRLLHHPNNLLLARRFVREWNSLSEIKKKQLRKSGYIFDSPIQAHEALKKGRPYEMCKKRFLTKEDLAKSALEKAKDVGGTVRLITKPSVAHKKGVTKKQAGNAPNNTVLTGDGVVAHNQTLGTDMPSPVGKSSSIEDSSGPSGPESDIPGTSSNAVTASSGSESCNSYVFNSEAITKKRTYLQVVDKDGCPLCLFCGQATLSEAESRHKGAAWDRRFCSEQCKEEHGLRNKSSKFAREKLLEAEHGICQQCGLHAHDLFTQVRDMAKSQRKDFLKSTPYASLSAQKLNEMIKTPYAGQYWHADHIVAVYEGGGLCSLDNLRTLCVMCHEKVTNEQNRQRRKQKRVQQQREAGFGDIATFFKS